MIKLSIDWSPLKNLIRSLPGEAKKARPAALKAAANELLNATDEAFTDPSYRQKNWAPLSPKTIARKPANSGILVNSGILKNASLGKYVNPSDNTIGVSTSCKYAATHQFGRGPIPARPFVPITEDGDIAPAHVKDDVVTEYADTIENALEKAVKKAPSP